MLGTFPQTNPLSQFKTKKKEGPKTLTAPCTGKSISTDLLNFSCPQVQASERVYFRVWLLPSSANCNG